MRRAVGRLAAMILTGIALIGCGGSPTAPSARTYVAIATEVRAVAPVLSLSIFPAIGVLRVGQSQAFNFVAELGEGVPPSGPMPPWSSSDSSVVTVDPSGVATAIAPGEATIQVTFQDKTATRSLQVITP